MFSYLTNPIVLVTSVVAFVCCSAGQASARTFGGYDCTDDCVSHAAGYLWAEEREVESIDGCPENRSEAFYEGCLTYVDDPERGAKASSERAAPARTRVSDQAVEHVALSRAWVLDRLMRHA